MSRPKSRLRHKKAKTFLKLFARRGLGHVLSLRIALRMFSNSWRRRRRSPFSWFDFNYGALWASDKNPFSAPSCVCVWLRRPEHVVQAHRNVCLLSGCRPSLNCRPEKHAFSPLKQFESFSKREKSFMPEKFSETTNIHMYSQNWSGKLSYTQQKFQGAKAEAAVVVRHWLSLRAAFKCRFSYVLESDKFAFRKLKTSFFSFARWKICRNNFPSHPFNWSLLLI